LISHNLPIENHLILIKDVMAARVLS